MTVVVPGRRHRPRMTISTPKMSPVMTGLSVVRPANTETGMSETRTNSRLPCGDRELDLSRTHVMGILNMTPDSFSDGGRYNRMDAALQRVEQMLAAGATLVAAAGVGRHRSALGQGGLGGGGSGSGQGVAGVGADRCDGCRPGKRGGGVEDGHAGRAAEQAAGARACFVAGRGELRPRCA